MGARANEYGYEITYELDLLRAVEEESPELDGEGVAAAIKRLRDDATKGDGRAQAALVGVGLLLDRARERRKRVEELRRRLRVWHKDEGAIGGANE
jgi:hypothetical protein